MKNGLKTTRSPRLTNAAVVVFCIADWAAGISSVQSGVAIYDSFDPGGTFHSQNNLDATLAQKNLPANTNALRAAARFTVTNADFFLSSITLPISVSQSGTTTNVLRVRLTSDAGGAPGSTLEVLSQNQGIWPAMANPFTNKTVLLSVTSPRLFQGSNYWIVTEPTAFPLTGPASVDYRWFDSSNGPSLTIRQQQTFGGALPADPWPGASSSGQLAFRVDGIPVRDYGVDVSHFQGETGIPQTNWNQLYSEGKRFAFVKATESLTIVDVTMADNMGRAMAAGIRAGVYHFAHPELHSTTSGAVQEADYLLGYAGNFIGPGYLRPVLDLEVGSTIGVTALTDWVIAFSNEIIAKRGQGAAPIVYTPQSYATSALDSRVAGYDLWLSDFTSVDTSTNDPPGGLGVFTNWSFWQYAVGSAGGLGSVDLDVCHSEFKPLASFVIPAVTNPVGPAIASQPQSRTVRAGTPATFAVGSSISSSTPLLYQWRFFGTNIPGANANTFSRTNAQLPDAGPYSVVITNAASSVTSSVATLTVLKAYPPVAGTVLYQENFDSYAAESVITSPATTNGFKIFFGAASGPVDFSARFGFDYSTVASPTSIPSAPHSTNGTTKGLRLTVNKDATAAAAAVNLYPLSQVFTGNFALKFDLWINYPNSSTATEHALFGINHSGNITNRIGQTISDGLFFALDGDGGVSAGSATVRDFSVFSGGTSGIPVLLLTNNTPFGPEPPLGPQFDNSDPGLAVLFPSKSLGLFSAIAGSAGEGWLRVEVRQTSNVVTWLLNGSVIAQYTNTTSFTNGNILIGYNDALSSIGGSANFAVFDNLLVETIADVDDNGLADAWEMQYFGHTGVNPDADPDGDGASNLQEFLAGTNPTNAASFLHLLSPGPAAINNGKDFRLDWTTSGGHSYVVQFATNGPGGFAANFADLSPVIPVPGTGAGTTNYVHVGALTNKGSFYRIRLAP